MKPKDQNKAIIKKYFNKYFPDQYFREFDYEFKSLLRILNKKDKQKTLCKPAVLKCSNCGSANIIKEDVYRCKECTCFHGKHGQQL